MSDDATDLAPEVPADFSVPWLRSGVGRFLAGHGDPEAVTWPAMGAAWDRAQATLQRLTGLFQTGLPSEVSVVVFGSLARREETPGSDVDWCLLIDGRADSDHRRLQAMVEERLVKAGLKAPNRTGAFGAMNFSHELIHCIGGRADTNDNLTLRMLLLLESVEVTPASPVSPHTRIRRAILQRYFEEESFFPGKPAFFPRFFLNDVVRFWRTMAVDYAAKTSERGPKGWALRNAKLRFSRKLLFVTGLLLACEPHFFGAAEPDPPAVGEQAHLFHLQLSGGDLCHQALRRTPLETLTRVCTRLRFSEETLRTALTAYNEFLALLGDADSRGKLKELTFADASGNALFQRVRQLGAEFQTGLDRIFLEGEDNPLRQLTLKYGIF